MSFRISGLPAEPFTSLFSLDDEALARAGARRYIADAKPGFPCRVTLEDAEPGERVLLVHYVHQPADTPFPPRCGRDSSPSVHLMRPI